MKYEGDIIYEDESYVVEQENKSYRRGNPNWKRGGSSPNPAGRPRVDMNLIEYIKQEVGDNGEELINYLLDMARNDSTTIKGNYPPYPKDLQFKAIVELLDRGWGKVRQSLDINANINYQLSILQAIKIIDERRRKVIEVNKEQIRSNTEDIKLINSK